MDSSTQSFLLVLACIVIILLYSKFRRQKRKNNDLFRQMNKLQADNAMLFNDHLKFQLQPHTLNNILANLKVFSNKLNKGLDSLSETLEYIIYKGNNQLVSVQDELHFVNKYLELNDLFTNEIDSILLDATQVNIGSKNYHTACIPHLITAYFIENAFKHGDVNDPHFLRVQISLTDKLFSMKVINKIKMKQNNGNGGIGLKNMKERLDLLLPGKYQINSSSNGREYESNLLIRF